LEILLATTADAEKRHAEAVKKLNDEIKTAKSDEKKERDKAATKQTELAQANAKIQALRAQLGETGDSNNFDWKSPWVWTVVAVSVAIVLASVLMFRASKATEEFIDDRPRPKSNQNADDADFKDPPEGTNTN
jgi:hypothetical protein